MKISAHTWKVQWFTILTEAKWSTAVSNTPNSGDLYLYALISPSVKKENTRYRERQKSKRGLT